MLVGNLIHIFKIRAHTSIIILGASGDITPISFESELEITTETPITQLDYDNISFTEDDTITAKSSDTSCPSVMDIYENNTFFQGITTPKAVTPSTENVNVCKNIFQQPTPVTLKHTDNTDKKGFINRIYNEFEEKSTTKRNTSQGSNLYEKDTISSSKNLSTSGCSKWITEKEKFMDTTRNLELVKAQYTEKNIDMLKNLNIDCDKSKITKDPTELNTLKVASGAVIIKEKYIEPPKVTRVSRSFHGKSNTASSLDISSSPRRASDGVPVTNLKCDRDSEKGKINAAKRKFVSQLSQPSTQNPEDRKHSLTDNVVTKPRFTTRIVDEAEHAASIGLASYHSKISDSDGQVGSSGTEEKNDS